MANKSNGMRLPLMASAAFLAVVTAGVVVPQMVSPVQAHVGAAIVAQRDLRFSDRADGGVTVTNAVTGAVVEELAPESHNFVRALMRGLVRQRVREGDGPETPFRLTAWADGTLTLEDPATHRSVALEAFGPTNAEEFVRLLPLKVTAK